MAKKKRHKSKKNKHNNKVVKNTTENKKISKVSDLEETKIEKEVAKNENIVESNYVVSDVKFSLILLLAIVVSFILLSLVFQNKAVSDQLYGLVKINI